MANGASDCKGLSLFRALLVFRICNALLTTTFFQADEFWQALEPAHFKAFGFGELTWEWKHGLRSYAFPFIFEIGYRFVKLSVRALNTLRLFIVRFRLLHPSSLDIEGDHSQYMSAFAEHAEYYGVIFAPKLVMSVVAALGEYYMIKWIQKMYLLATDKNDDVKHTEMPAHLLTISKILTLTNFFNCFIITRSFINSFEMSLTCIALFYWDWSSGDAIDTSGFTKSVAIAIFTCLQRPSNGLIWLILGSFLLINLLSMRKFKKIGYLFAKIGLVLIATTMFNCLIDYYFYGRLVFPIFRFLKFNFTTPLSNFYGVSPWHFHLFQSLPIILGYSAPLFVYGLFTRLFNKKFSPVWLAPSIQLKTVVIANLVAYSALPHKEFRFIYPLQPFFILMSSVSAAKLHARFKINGSRYKNGLWAFPIISVLTACLLCTQHEKGVISVMRSLHFQPKIESIGFLMPCHSTPWQSYLHRNDIEKLWAITCDPPLHLLDDPDAHNKLLHYMDESDYLYDEIPEFLRQNFPAIGEQESESAFRYDWPEYLVIFEHLDSPYMKSYLEDSSYTPFSRFFNSFSHWDSRREGDIIVYKKTNS